LPTPTPTQIPTELPTAQPTIEPSPLPTTPPTLIPTSQLVAVGDACPSGAALVTQPAVSVGEQQAWILASDGTVYGTGVYITISQKFTATYTKFLTGVKSISSGRVHTLFLMDNGVVCGHGEKRPGSLCMYGSTTDIWAKEPIVVATGVKSMSAQWEFSVFLKETGDLYGCGKDRGQLGQMYTTNNRSTPVLIQRNVSSAYAGVWNVVMKLTNGSTFVTGNDQGGQFGFDSHYESTFLHPYEGSTLPIELPPKPEGHTFFGAGYNKFWFKDEDGMLYGRGMNKWCEMGLPLTDAEIRTTPVVDHIKAVYSLYHTIFLLDNGTAYFAGDDSFGQFGDGRSNDGNKASKCGLNRMMDNVTTAAVGSKNSLVLTADGTVYAAGYHGWGLLGDGTFAQSSTWVKVMIVH